MRAVAVHLDQNSGLAMTEVGLRALAAEQKLWMELEVRQRVPADKVSKDRLELRIRNFRTDEPIINKAPENRHPPGTRPRAALQRTQQRGAADEVMKVQVIEGCLEVRAC